MLSSTIHGGTDIHVLLYDFCLHWTLLLEQTSIEILRVLTLQADRENGFSLSQLKCIFLNASLAQFQHLCEVQNIDFYIVVNDM